MIQDPDSSNEIHRIHKYGNSRCAGNTFECPKCNKYFDTSDLLQNHIGDSHAQDSSVSMVSEASSSVWMYVSCTECELKFENEGDMRHHVIRVHEYGESCLLYPCDECGYSAGDVHSLKDHKLNEHGMTTSLEDTEMLLVEDEDTTNSEDSNLELIVSKRIEQKLDDVDFSEDSDEDEEYSPTPMDNDPEDVLVETISLPNEMHCCDQCDFK